MPDYAPCPQCASTKATKVSFTWWGGLLGPSLLTHVSCDHCGTTYNGKTGKYNTAAIAVYVAVSFIVVIGFLVFLKTLK